MGKRETIAENTAKALKKIRYDVGMTQENFASAIDVSVSAVKQWELGLSIPSPSSYVKICKYVDSEIIIKALEEAREKDQQYSKAMKSYNKDTKIK